MEQPGAPSAPFVPGAERQGRTGGRPHSSTAVRTVWYRSVACWRRQRGSYLVLVLLIGLLGGVALGSLAAARRTASSFSTYLAGTNPSDLVIVPAGGPGLSQPNVAQHLVDAVRRYPQVKHVESYRALNASLVKAGKVDERSLSSNVVLVGSIDGLLFNQDRFAVTSGRMADPARADEVDGDPERRGGAGAAPRPGRPRRDPPRIRVPVRSAASGSRSSASGS